MTNLVICACCFYYNMTLLTIVNSVKNMKSINIKSTVINNVRNRRVEILLDNHLDNNIQAMLLPLNLMQTIYFCHKYNIRDNFITPNGSLSRFITFCGACIFVGLYIYRIISTALNENLFKSSTVNFNFYLDCLFFCIGHTLNFLTTLVSSDANVELAIKIQSIYRTIKIDDGTFKHFVIWNWLQIFNLFATYSLVILIINTFVSLDLLQLVYYLLPLSFDLNMIYATRIIKFLKYELNLWTRKVFEEVENTKSHVLLTEEQWRIKLFHTYEKIIEGYNLWQKLFEFVIAFHTFETFFHTLLHIQILIEVLKSDQFKFSVLFVTVLVLFWFTKNIILLVLLCGECEAFCIEIENIEVACMMKLSICSDKEKKMFKNIKRLNSAAFQKLVACRLFNVDATLLNYKIK